MLGHFWEETHLFKTLSLKYLQIVMQDHLEMGKRGEQFAVELLREKGLLIRARNWRSHRYEIDIIAQAENTLVVVEVKTRNSSYLNDPAQAVTPAKQKLIIKAANLYLEEQNLDLEVRFDVIGVVHNRKGTHASHFEDAFYPTL